ncbi:MAG: hypothetical protein JW885_02790 [Deltaproteobacteria bacterium]|nr:hypothetical protein [Candidatus Zymogenaceae bacterium]
MGSVIFQENFIGSDIGLAHEISDTGATYVFSGGSGLIAIENDVGNAGMLDSKKKLPASWKITIDMIPTETVGVMGAVVAGSEQPGLMTLAEFRENRRVWAWRCGWDAVHLCVRDTSGDVYAWSPAGAWTTDTVPFSASGFTQAGMFRLVMRKDGDRKVTLTLFDDGGGTLIETDPIEPYRANVHEDTWFVAGYPFTDEPFSTGYGFDGTQIEPIFWCVDNEWQQSSNVFSLDDKFIFDSGGAEMKGRVWSDRALRLSGDFDVQIDFNCSTLNAGTGAVRAIMFYLISVNDGRLTANNSVIITLQKSSSIHRYYFVVYVGGSLAGDEIVNTSDTSGKLRIIRDEGTFKGFYWNGSSWVQIGNDISGFNNDVVFMLRCDSNAASNVYEIDNLKINSGTIKLINRSCIYDMIWGRTVVESAPALELVNRLVGPGGQQTRHEGGDSLLLENAIRSRASADLELINDIGVRYDSADLLLVNSIGEDTETYTADGFIYISGTTYPVTDGTVTVGGETYDVIDSAVTIDGVTYAVRTFFVIIDGEDWTDAVDSVELTEASDTAPNSVRLSIVDEYRLAMGRMRTRADSDFSQPRIAVYIDGDLYDTYFWDNDNLSERSRETTGRIWGRNRAALLYYPYASKITRVWNAVTTRYAVINELCDACGLSLDYRVPDFAILAGALEVENEYPLDVIKTLCEVDGCYARSGGGDVLVIKDMLYIEE